MTIKSLLAKASHHDPFEAGLLALGTICILTIGASLALIAGALMGALR